MIAHHTSRDYLEGFLSEYAKCDREKLGADWREITLFDFSSCRHTVCSILNVRTDNGSWDIEVCNTCGTQVGKHCAHEKMEWFADGHVLICRNCGIDGT